MKSIVLAHLDIGIYVFGGAKRLALEEGVQEDDPELFSIGGKEEWQNVKTTLAKNQKERHPVLPEAIFMLMQLTKEVLAVLMVLEHKVQTCTNQALDCGVWWCFHALKQLVLALKAFPH